METPSAPSLYSVVRIVGLVVLALMLVAIVYAGWISAANWNAIRV